MDDVLRCASCGCSIGLLTDNQNNDSFYFYVIIKIDGRTELSNTCQGTSRLHEPASEGLST
jgi:hypothetical protein